MQNYALNNFARNIIQVIVGISAYNSSNRSQVEAWNAHFGDNPMRGLNFLLMAQYLHYNNNARVND